MDRLYYFAQDIYTHAGGSLIISEFNWLEAIYDQVRAGSLSRC